MKFKKEHNVNYDIRVGEIIKIYRKRSCMTQAELAKIIGVSTATIANYENGLTVPDIVTVDKIGDVLGVPNILSFCEPQDDIWINLYSVGNNQLEISEDGRILCEKSMISADIFKFYNCSKIAFACIEQHGCVYFLTNTDYVEPGDRTLVQFSDEKNLSFADFDGKFYTDINTKRQEENVSFVAAKVLGILKNFKKSEYTDHKYEIPLI